MDEKETIGRIKKLLREDACPFFTDEDLVFYLKENQGDADATVRQCLLIKAEDTSLSISGLQAADTSKYFRRLAQRYRKSNSKILPGG
nr:MAG TPA: hypothetical protein [Caudoviricetes sp.]